MGLLTREHRHAAANWKEVLERWTMSVVYLACVVPFSHRSGLLAMLFSHRASQEVVSVQIECCARNKTDRILLRCLTLIAFAINF